MINTRTKTVVYTLLAGWVGASCVDVGQDRADFDEGIGVAEMAAAKVVVTDGLARVLQLDAAGLVLWAQAPTLEIALEVIDPNGAPTALEVQNCVPDAQLTITGPDGLTRTPEASPGDRPTVRRWVIETSSPGAYVWRVASPRADARSAFRFVAFADVQRRLDGIQDLFGPMAREENVRFGLVSGDLTSRGTLPDLRQFQREMGTLPFPLYATLGNHDLGTDEHHFQRVFGRCSFSFEYGGVRFSLLDSASAGLAPKVSERLEDWLEAGRDGLHLVMMHIPPLDPVGRRNGGFASRLEASRLLSSLAQARVDLTIYGHVHSLYTFENAGIDAIISGGGGAIPQRLDGIGRHYLLVDADPQAQRFLSAPVRVYPAE